MSSRRVVAMVIGVVSALSVGCTPPPPADSTPPTLELPADIVQAATSAAGAEVTYTAAATDEVDGAITPTCEPPSGGLFGVGSTTVTCVATDAAGNSVTGQFTVTVTELVPVGAIAVDGGDHFNCALLDSGSVSCWGQNDLGQLGNGTTTASATPVTVTGITDAVDISVAGVSACALHADTTVSCWGAWDTHPSSVPVKILGVAGVVDIGMGLAHTCVVRSGGSVECWGYNTSGQLARDLSIYYESNPLIVPGVTDAVAITAGDEHNCVLRGDGTVTCWGANSFGQLGSPPSLYSAAPLTVAGLTGVTSIAAGDRHNCATLANGTAACWGANSFGQLGGDATSSPSDTPVSVTGLTGVHAVAVGSQHSCALLDSGHVSCWGYNFYGQLGNGTTAPLTTPTPVSDLGPATAVAAGRNHTCAILADGTAACWGSNDTGQLGPGAAGSHETTPVIVTGLT